MFSASKELGLLSPTCGVTSANDRDVSGVTDDKGTVVFYNKKANDLKTDIVVQLLDATLKPDFTYPSLNDGKNSYEAPAGDTPGNINMQISDNNEFSIGCKSMLGIEIGLDFDGRKHRGR